MTQEESPNGGNDSNQDTAPPAPIDASVPNDEKPDTPKKPRRKKQAINVNVVPQENNGQRIANWISAIATVISLGVGVVTLSLFNETKKANINSENAVGIATEALRHQVKQDSLDSISDYKKDTADFNNRIIERSGNQRSLNHQDSSVKAQIHAFQETQKEFEIQNKPFVQIIDMGLDNIKSGERPIIKFNFKVYGKQPVKLRDNKIQIYYWHETKPPTYLDKYQTDTIRTYLGEGALFQEHQSPRIYINKTDSIAIKNGISYFFVNGYLRYKNTVTNSENSYHYRYKFGYSAGQFDATGLIDTTIEVMPKIRK